MSAAGKAKCSQEGNGLSQTSIEESDSIKVPVVRQLKPPPEIWELVHPVPPRQSGHSYAFITRLVSSRSMFILLVVVILCVGGFIGVRNGKRIAGVRTAPVETATEVNSRKAAADKKSTEESNVPAPVATSSVNQTNAVGESENPKRKASRQRNKPSGGAIQVSNRSAVGKSVSSPEGSQVSLPGNQKTRPSVNTMETPGASSVDGVATRKSSLSPQLIDSPKTSAPRKSKVIQWP
jgi:hypothetical protein